MFVQTWSVGASCLLCDARHGQDQHAVAQIHATCTSIHMLHIRTARYMKLDAVYWQSLLRSLTALALLSMGSSQGQCLFPASQQQMAMQGCPPVDLLIRTSGEHRLSDFLLWQSRHAQLVFSNTLWPDYSFWDLLQALVQYQRSYPELQKVRQACLHPVAVQDASIVSTMVDPPSEREPVCDMAGVSGEACFVDDAAKCETGGNPAEYGLSADGKVDCTDVDTSDSSASSESRSASPVASSSCRPSIVLLSQHTSPGCRMCQGQQCQVVADEQQLHIHADASCPVQGRAHQTANTGSPVSQSARESKQQSDIIQLCGIDAAAHLDASKSVSSTTLHAEVDCRRTHTSPVDRQQSLHKLLKHNAD